MAISSSSVPTVGQQHHSIGQIVDPIVQCPSLASTVPNPFVQVFRFNTYDKIKIATLTFMVMPLRLVLSILLLAIAWGLAGIGLAGLDKEELSNKPLSSWRRRLKDAVCQIVRIAFVVCGFHWVNVKGRQASAKEAPILAFAPHSSFFDALPVVYCGGASIVAKVGSERLPFFGKLMDFSQAVYVNRDDANSRQNTIKELQRRSHSLDDWNQIAIFPEGTCTNRSSLIAFKLGCFYPGLPIQPVCIKYPNRLDTITWTWFGAGPLRLLWLSLCQFHLRCEIEFLPVYMPSDEEIKNPRLFAWNVRQEMAKALGIPVSDYSYDDFSLNGKQKRNDAVHKQEEDARNCHQSNGLGCVFRYSDSEKNKAEVHANSEVSSNSHGDIMEHVTKPKSE